MGTDNEPPADDDARDAATSLSPPDLGQRGTALWRDVAALGSLDAAGRVLLHEACRITDRLEQLQRLLTGDDDVWARIALPSKFGSDDELVLQIGDAMTEARQQATTLRLLLGQLGLGKLAAAPEQKGSVLDQLGARRAARRAAAAAAERPG